MDWQLVVVGPIVAGAAWYLGRQTWSTWSGKKAGCTGCSCKGGSAPAGRAAGQGTLIPREQLTLRRREPEPHGARR